MKRAALGDLWTEGALRQVALMRATPNLPAELAEALAEGDRLHPGDPRRHLAVDVGPDPVDVDEETTEAFDALVRQNGAVARRSSWTADQLMAEEFPDPRWAVPGLVAEGVNLLAGAPKLGKSWMALGLGVAVASGGKALGRIDVDEGQVLALCLEDTPRRLKSRLSKILAGNRPPSGLTIAVECPPLPCGGDERIADWLERHSDARLVVIDVFARVRGSAIRDSSVYDADYAAISRAKAIADQYGVALVIVHHVRKAGSTDWLDLVSGSNGIAGAADAIAVLTRSRGTADAKLSVTGRDVEEAEHALTFSAEAGTWALLDGPASDYEVSDQRRRIIAAVRGADGIGPKQIAEKSGVAYGVVRHLVRGMVDEGQLDTDGAGHYFTVHNVHSVHRSR